MKLMKLPAVVEATAKLGYAPEVIVPLGIVLLTCTILYLLSRTSVFGAILLTGYLGGAVATHVHTDRGAFEVFFAVPLRGRDVSGHFTVNGQGAPV